MSENREVVRGIDEQILRIDEMVTNLDREWVNSDKILEYLRKNKSISRDFTSFPAAGIVDSGE